MTERDSIDAIIDVINANAIDIKQGIMNILRWVQSQAEFENVFQHCSLTLGERKYPDWKGKMTEIAGTMYFGEVFNLKGEYLGDGKGNHYGGDFEKLYNSLSRSPMCGFPVMDNGSDDYQVAKDSINRRYYQDSQVA